MQSFSLLILINVHVSFFFLHHHRVQLEVPLYSLQIQRNAIEKFLFLVSTVKHIKYNRERLSAPTIPSWLLAHDGDYFRHLTEISGFFEVFKKCFTSTDPDKQSEV